MGSDGFSGSRSDSSVAACRSAARRSSAAEAARDRKKRAAPSARNGSLGSPGMSPKVVSTPAATSIARG